MARKIFVSYKYGDSLVQDLNLYDKYWRSIKTTARHYVDALQEKIGRDHINLGEKDGESLADFSDTTIETSLKKKIAQCSVTIVLISKGMKSNEAEKEQWIPWEISYSLRTVPSGGNTKQMNAVLGVVLPDETGSYDWYYVKNSNCNSVLHQTAKLFKILRDNIFNIKEKNFRECDGSMIYTNDEPSFIKTIEWNKFLNGNNYNFYIEEAVDIKNNSELYDVHINLD